MGREAGVGPEGHRQMDTAQLCPSHHTSCQGEALTLWAQGWGVPASPTPLICPWAPGGPCRAPGRMGREGGAGMGFLPGLGHWPTWGRGFSGLPTLQRAQEGSPGTRSPSSSSSESSGQDSGVEPLLSVTWLWPEGWSLALRSRRSGPGPWREMELLGPGTHSHPPHPALASCSSCSPGGLLGALLASGTSALLWQDSSRRGGSKRRKLLS